MRSDQNEYEDKYMTLDSEPSTPDPTNTTDNIKTAPVINSDDEIEATRTNWKTNTTPILVRIVLTYPLSGEQLNNNADIYAPVLIYLINSRFLTPL